MKKPRSGAEEVGLFRHPQATPIWLSMVRDRLQTNKKGEEVREDDTNIPMSKITVSYHYL